MPAPAAAPTARTRILQQAVEQLFAHGYRAFRMADLAADLGMSKRTLYQHFPDKDAVIRTAISLFAAQVRAEVDAIFVRPRLTLAEKLRGFAEAMVVRLSRVQPSVLLDLQRRAPALYHHLDQLRRDNISYAFGRFISDGLETGLVHGEINPVFAGEFFLHAMQGVMHPATLRQLQLTPAQAFEQALHLFFGGLLTSTGLKQYEKCFPR